MKTSQDRREEGGGKGGGAAFHYTEFIFMAASLSKQARKNVKVPSLAEQLTQEIQNTAQDPKQRNQRNT